MATSREYVWQDTTDNQGKTRPAEIYNSLPMLLTAMPITVVKPSGSYRHIQRLTRLRLNHHVRGCFRETLVTDESDNNAHGRTTQLRNSEVQLEVCFRCQKCQAMIYQVQNITYEHDWLFEFVTHRFPNPFGAAHIPLKPRRRLEV